MKKEIRIVQIGISLLAIVVALSHLIWPSLAIDGITLMLITIAIVPWLVPLFKSLELPGGVKIEFQELKNIQENIEKVGLATPKIEKEAKPEYAFQIVVDEDPNLALAGLRIEIEKRLRDIAKANDINTEGKSFRPLLELLSRKEVITSSERAVLADLAGLLNQAVHGAKLDQRATEWAMDVGPRIIKALDQRIEKL